MGNFQIPNTSVVYSNPKQVNQNTLTFPPGTVTPGYPPNVNGTLAGVVWVQNGPTAHPQPGSFDPTLPKANPILVNAQPKPLTDGGIKIPNSSVVFKSPA
jgi:hypothetical protein